MGSPLSHMEEDPYGLDGGVGGQQNGPAHAHVPILHPDLTHIAPGTCSTDIQT